MRPLLFILLLNVAFLDGCGGNHHVTAPMTDPVKSLTGASLNANTPILQEPNEINQTQVVYEVKNNEKEIALTFDDGPDQKYTPQILDLLKNNHIHATFFLIGEQAEKYPSIVKRINEEGHAIGNHTWDHPDMEKLSVQQMESEITKTDNVLKQISGIKPTLFRAPYGAVSPEVKAEAAKTGHQIIGWSVDTMDWDGKSVAQILTAIHKEGKSGSIILQHSAGGKNGNLNNTVAALPQIIHYFQQNGYRFVTVPALLSSQ